MDAPRWRSKAAAERFEALHVERRCIVGRLHVLRLEPSPDIDFIESQQLEADHIMCEMARLYALSAAHGPTIPWDEA